ncbi:MAG: hypothetical protein ACREUY_06380 [Burkholderiales bacterium]
MSEHRPFLSVKANPLCGLSANPGRNQNILDELIAQKTSDE